MTGNRLGVWLLGIVAAAMITTGTSAQTTGSAKGAVSGPVNINTAPASEIEELMNVRGIGEKAFLTLKPQITIAPPKAAER